MKTDGCDAGGNGNTACVWVDGLITRSGIVPVVEITAGDPPSGSTPETSMDKNLSAALIATVAIFGALSLTACNTLEGAGKDVERAGEKIQESNCTREDAASDPNCN